MIEVRIGFNYTIESGHEELLKIDYAMQEYIPAIIAFKYSFLKIELKTLSIQWRGHLVNSNQKMISVNYNTGQAVPTPTTLFVRKNKND